MYVKFLLANVFENFRNMCLEMYGLDSVCFFVAKDYHGNQHFEKPK